MEIKVGQRWRTRGAGPVEIAHKHLDKWFKVGFNAQPLYTIDQEGRFNGAYGTLHFGKHDCDLVERIESVYIAGLPTCVPDYHAPYHVAAADYRARGCHVENPVEIEHIDSAEFIDMQRKELARLLTCDTLVLLPGWNVPTLCIEYQLAMALGMAIVYPNT